MQEQEKISCETSEIRASQILHKIISTHLLTVLTIRAILHIEQRRGEESNRKENPNPYRIDNKNYNIDNRRNELC